MHGRLDTLALEYDVDGWAESWAVSWCQSQINRLQFMLAALLSISLAPLMHRLIANLEHADVQLRVQVQADLANLTAWQMLAFTGLKADNTGAGAM